MKRRRNTDEDLRALERAAAAGDTAAAARLVRARQRAGQPENITIRELAATSGSEVVDVLRSLPDELGGAWWRARLERTVGAAMPRMTHDEIMQALGPSARSDYERALENEAEALSRLQASGRRRSARLFMAEAQGFYASDVSDFLEHPERFPEPHEIFSQRRTPVAWAIAERIRQEARSRRAAPAGRPISMPPMSRALARLFRAEVNNHREMLRRGEFDEETPDPTLGSALDSVYQGYDPGHGDDMMAVERELLALIEARGEATEISAVWDGRDPDEYVTLDEARRAAADAAYAAHDFGAAPSSEEDWVFGPGHAPADTWRRAVLFGDGDVTIFVVQFAANTADVIDVSAE